MPIEPIIDVELFRDDVSIPAVDIDTAFRDQASLFARYAELHFRAQRQALNKKIMVDVVEATLDKEIRDRAVADGAKTTEDGIKKEIKRSAKYISASKEHLEAEAIEAFLKNALEAFKQRKDMLISLGANQRQEMQGELRMNTAVAGSPIPANAAEREALLRRLAATMGRSA